MPDTKKPAGRETPAEGWTKARDKPELIEKVNALAASTLPGALFTFSQPIEMRFNDMLSGVKGDLGVAVYGEDLFRTGGSDHGAGNTTFVVLELLFAAWSLALLVVGLRAVRRQPGLERG